MTQLELNQILKPRFHHAAKFKDSPRLQALDKFLISKGKAGATTFEIMEACNCGGVSRDVDELRKNGIDVVCRYVGLNANGRKVFCYWHPAFAPQEK